ncbi:exodeoxyribonuclease VII large subunit [Pontibacter sp. BAB1700]|uniref:exodeoxyribonuclease VII large subunit n=1 Tax=Pontibacter sp. BAB1700 TaxID=1144253 RepID=UPI0003075E59|nr:exodeoxyribonuclease VII large subunit [Pontibacter sp. BAB1700]
MERQSLKISNLTNGFLQENREQLEHFSKSLLLKPKSFLENQKHQLLNSERLLQAYTKDLLHLRGKELSDLTVCVEGIGQRWLHMKEQDLNKLVHCIETEAKDKHKRSQLSFVKCSDRLQYSAQKKLSSDSHRLDMLEMRIQANDPEKLLLRGYTLTLINGKIIKYMGQVKEGDVIETRLQDGKVHSLVVNKDENE